MTPPGASIDEATAWAALHDNPTMARRGFAFQNSLAQTLAACRPFARPGQLWVDAGCGPGHLARAVSALGPRVLGVDEDPAALALARRYPAAPGARAVPQFIRGLVTDVALPDHSADEVAAASLAGCLPDLDGFLAECRRLVRPGGHVVMTATNASSLLLRINSALRAVEQRRIPSVDERRRYRNYRAADVTRALRTAGFEPVRLSFFNYVLNAGPWLLPPNAVARRLTHDAVGVALDRRRSRLARNFVVVAAA